MKNPNRSPETSITRKLPLALMAALGLAAAQPAPAKASDAATPATDVALGAPVTEVTTMPAGTTDAVTAETTVEPPAKKLDIGPINDELAKAVLRELLNIAQLYQEAGKALAEIDLEFFQTMKDNADDIVRAQISGIRAGDVSKIAEWLRKKITQPNIEAQTTRIETYEERLTHRRTALVNASKNQCKEGNPPECSEMLANRVQEDVERQAELQGVGQKLFAAFDASGLIEPGVKTLTPYYRLLAVADAVMSLPAKERNAILGIIVTEPEKVRAALEKAREQGYAEAATLATTTEVPVARTELSPFSAFAETAIHGQDKANGPNDIRYENMRSLSVGARYNVFDWLAGEAGVQGLSVTPTYEGPNPGNAQAVNVATPFVGVALQREVLRKGDFTLEPRVRGDVGYSIGHGLMTQGIGELETKYKNFGLSLGFGVHRQAIQQVLGQNWHGKDVITNGSPALTPVGKVGISYTFGKGNKQRGRN